MKRSLWLLVFCCADAAAAPFLVSDPIPAVQGAYLIDSCAYVRSGSTSYPAVEVVAGGVRCKIDLAGDPKTGTVTVAFRDSVLGVVGPTSAFAFGAIPTPSNLRMIP